MTSYQIIPRNYPSDTSPINFNNTSSTFGMLNLIDWQNEINSIEKVDECVINENEISIYFPTFDYFFVKRYSSNNGFTFRQLMKKIMKTAIQAGKYDCEHYPEHYFSNNPTYKNFISNFAITSGDIEVKDNNVYVSVQS